MLVWQEPVDYNITRYRTRLGKDLVVSELMKTPLIQHSQRLKWEVERSVKEFSPLTELRGPWDLFVV